MQVGGLSGPRELPLIVLPKVREGGLDDQLPQVRACAERSLSTIGGLLFRGFRVDDDDSFQRLVRSFGYPSLGYDFGSTPRTQVAEGLYSSTEYPAHQHIPLHNEQAYCRQWPMKLWFYCGLAAERGGETPIADSRQVFARIDPAIRRRFFERGVMYVRNYGGGLDLPWQRVFNTTSRENVEAYCRAQGVDFEWKEDGELRTRQVCQAAAEHPETGEWVWFNQAHLFHLSALEPAVREALLDVVEPEDCPRNAYYGDGGAIEESALQEVRGVLDELEVVFSWQSGDVLMLDNMLVAHGRRPFVGARRVLVAMAQARCAAGS